MSKPSLFTLSLRVLSISTCLLLALPATADSQARIVRLSDVQGSVEIDKNTGMGFEGAFLNLPITQGTQLRTRDGRAEIEFEDGSTMRLTPNSSVRFNTLGLSDAGKRISAVNLVEGMAYVNWIGKSGDQFTLNFSREKVSLEHAAHFRVEASSASTKLAVFKGDLDVESPSGSFVVEKRKTATFDTSNNDKYAMVDDVEEETLDSWDRQAIAYHDQYAKNSVSSPYGYGLSDLNYYGSYSDVPGYGMMWQPYFTGIGWDPFLDGAWSWYPGYGYMFASPYPWGWMPYRYGNWLMVPGFGWMWQPGGWNSWVSVPHYSGTLAHALVAPTGTGKTVVVGRTGTVTSQSVVAVRANSAGLGIPRGSLGNLNHLSRQVGKNGSVDARVGQQFSASSGRSSSFASHSAISSPPPGHTSAVHAPSGHR